MRRAILTLGLIVLLGTACDKDCDFSTEQLDLFEAVIRAEIDPLLWGQLPQDEPVHLYVSILDCDPPTEFMNRLGDLNVSLAAGSDYGPEQGYLVYIAHVSNFSSDAAEGTAGYDCGPLCAGNHTWEMSLQPNGWQVVRRDVNWVS